MPPSFAPRVSSPPAGNAVAVPAEDENAHRDRELIELSASRRV